MDPTRFDRLSKLLASRWTRRQAVTTGGAGLAATGLLAGRLGSAAQEASPTAVPVGTPTDPHPSSDIAQTDPEYLFVQPFESGAWAPKPGEDGVVMLTLSGVAAQTAYFSDRPERDVGLAPTQPFLDGLGFSPDNPPNAALVAQTEAGEQEVLVVELLAPVYDAEGATLTYEATVLADYGGRGLATLAQQQTDYELTESFGEGSLFIDDCWDSTDDGCWYNTPDGGYISVGNVTSGNCWNQDGQFGCNPCHSYSELCNQTYPDACAKDPIGCSDDIAICGAPGCR